MPVGHLVQHQHYTRRVNNLGLPVPAHKGLTFVLNPQKSRSCKWHLAGSPRAVQTLAYGTRVSSVLSPDIHICVIHRFESSNEEQQPLNCQTCRRRAKAALPLVPSLGRDAVTSLGKGPRPAQNRWQTWSTRTSSAASSHAAPNFCGTRLMC